MKTPRAILITVGSFAGWVLFDRWQDLYTSILEQVHPYFPDVVLIGLVIIGAVAGLYEWKFSKDKKQESKTIQKVVTETLADKHKEIDEYTNHLRKDILEVLKSKNTSFFDALSKEQEKKKMILQHMYTYEEIEGHPFYRNYHKVWIVNNNKRQSRFDLGSMCGKLWLETTNICRNIRDFSSNGTVEHNVLLHTLGFQTNVGMFDDSFDIDKIHPIPEENINEGHFYVERDYEDKTKYYVKYHETIIAACNSKKIANKLLKTLLKHCSEIIKYATERAIENADVKMFEGAFEKMFSDLDKTLEHGKPNFGVCDACVNFFPYQNKQRYKNFLWIGNNNPLNWDSETLW